MAVIKNKRILKCLLMMVVSLLLVLGVSIGVSASGGYDKQEADACITISQRLSVKGGSNGVYEKAPYHGKNNSGRKNKAPMNGQEALDNSVPIGSNTTRRIGISEGEIVVLDETTPGIFHGHVRSWDELSEAMKAALRKSGKVNKKGKIINDD